MNAVNFGSLFDFQKKSKIKAGDGLALIDGNFPFFTSSNILSKSLNDYNFEGESLIFGTGGSASVHYCNERFSASTDCFVTMPKVGIGIYAKYVYYFLIGNIDLIESGFKGAGLKHVSKHHISDLKIPVTTLHEQKKIAAILDAADDYRQKTKALIEKYDELTQSLFLDMFGDPFIENNKKNIVPFKELTNRITYGFTNPMKHLDSGIPILTAKNIRNGYIDYEKTHFADEEEYNKLTIKSKPEKFDILITKDGSIGRTAMLESDFPVCINQSVALVKPKKEIVNPKYLVGYLVSAPVQRKIQNMGKGAGLKHLQITELAEFPTVLFSLNEQNQFAERVAQIETQKQQAEASLVKAEELFNSLLQRAFKGELTN